MKQILIATALAGAMVGGFASLGFAAPLPAQLGHSRSAGVISVDVRCGPYHHFMHGFRDRYGRWIPGRCVRDHRDYRYYHYR